MSIISKLTKKELIIIDNENINYENLFLELFNILKEKGYVEETFFDAILKRERKYPTGLELPSITIAIPHTDVEYIKEPFIFINKMKSRSIEFTQMGTDDKKVYPEFIIILGIKEKTAQVGLLSEIINLFDNKEFISEIREADNIEKIYKIFTKK